MELATEHNLSFVDGQNLYFGTNKCHVCARRLKKELKDIKLEECTCGLAWTVDLAKFRVYLKENYGVEEAYYFMGFLQQDNDELYKAIQKAGFIIVFREHHKSAKSKKKGNVDTEIVFEIMKHIADNPNFNKIVLISGDGDYKKMVKYLISKDKFKKILFPNKEFASSLYYELGSEYFDYLENVRNYISY